MLIITQISSGKMLVSPGGRLQPGFDRWPVTCLGSDKKEAEADVHPIGAKDC